nr:pilus assembly protein PapD [Rickettsia sp. Tenjiku01]
MTVQNNDYAPKKFQLIRLKRTYKETKDLVATPVTFTLHDGTIDTGSFKKHTGIILLKQKTIEFL